MNPMNTAASTTPQMISSRRSLIASRSFSAITSATLSGSPSKEPRNSSGSMATKTAMASAAIGAMCSRKSLKVSPDRLAMMMLGGSPIKVAAPPMLDAKHLGDQEGNRRDAQPLTDQQGDRGDQQHGGDVVQHCRGDRRDQHQQHHHPKR